MCAYLGGFNPHSQNNCKCIGTDEIHSSPRITWVVRIKWSSTTWAKWYVGVPSFFKSTTSRIFSGISISPLITSLNLILLSSLPGDFNLTTYSSPFSILFCASSTVMSRYFANSPYTPGSNFSLSCFSLIVASSSSVIKHGYASPCSTSDLTYAWYISFLLLWVYGPYAPFSSVSDSIPSSISIPKSLSPFTIRLTPFSTSRFLSVSSILR